MPVTKRWCCGAWPRLRPPSFARGQRLAEFNLAQVAGFPVELWPDGPRTKVTAAMWTNIVEDVFDAGTTEGAFKRADHRVRGIWRKLRVTVLASGS